jgi:hypothetical protein
VSLGAAASALGGRGLGPAGDVDVVTTLLLAAIALAAGFFLLRPEIWARLWFAPVDPRPAALARIAFGLVVLWTFLHLTAYARLLFTDEGLWLASMARARHGGPLGSLWDPQLGFEHWWSGLRVLASRASILHLRSDPPAALLIHGLALVSLSLMVAGAWTRWTTILSWVLVEQLYRYAPVFLNGGDFVIRAFLFLGMLSQWGEAYSIDSWRRRRAATRAGAAPPTRRAIPAWPLRLMMLQLACIYCVNGLKKHGVTWQDGTALYYALNLDDFYRVPAQGLVSWLQQAGVLPLLTWATRWWELLFPVALAGAALNGYEDDRRRGRWPLAARGRRRASWAIALVIWLIGAAVAGIAARHYLPLAGLPLGASRGQLAAALAIALGAAPLAVVPAYRLARTAWPGAVGFVLRWVVGKRLWLAFGVALHLGIDLSINVGTFAEVMIAVYAPWLSGSDLDAVRRLLPGRATWTRVAWSRQAA